MPGFNATRKEKDHCYNVTTEEVVRHECVVVIGILFVRAICAYSLFDIFTKVIV